MTPALGLLLTSCALMAPPAGDEEPSARARVTLEQVSKLPQEHQRVWLRLIEQRYGWAALLTLKPDDARREQVRVAKILRQKTVGWNDLLGLLRDLDQREKAAISRLVRQYRSQVYETFRTRPGELVDRQEAWYRIWTLWEKAGSPPQQQDRLMDWLAAAIKASARDATGPLPPDPKFGEGLELVPEQLVEELSRPAKPEPAQSPQAGPPAESPPPGPTLEARAPLELRLPDPGETTHLEKRPLAALVVPPRETPESLPRLVANPPAVMPARHVFPPVVVKDLWELTQLMLPRLPAVLAIERHEALAIADRPAGAVAGDLAGNLQAKQPSLESRRQAADMPPLRTVEPPSTLAPSSAFPAAAPPLARAVPPSSRLPGHGGEELAQLPRQFPDFNLPQPRRPVEYRVQRPALALADVGTPSFTPPAKPAAQPRPRAEVNIEELATRIEGINLSLRNLEGELNAKREFTVDQLDSLLSRLDILVLRQKDLSLFRDLITPQEQARVGQVDNARSIVATMGTRISELRTRVHDNEALPEAERTAVLKQLDDLSDRLATMTAER